MNGADKKSGPVVLVIDYGASNLRSVQKAFAKAGVRGLGVGGGGGYRSGGCAGAARSGCGKAYDGGVEGAGAYRASP